MPRILSALIWVGISLLGAGAFGYIALARGETIGAAWLVVAAVCTYLVAYRFYSRFIAEKVFELNPQPRDAGRAAEQRPRLRADEQVDSLRPSLLGHLRRGSAGRSDAGGAVRLPARHDLADRRRRARRRGAGLPDPLRVDAARRQVARSDREGGSEPGRRPGGDGRDLRDHDHPARRARAGRRQRAARQPVGPVHAVDDDSRSRSSWACG